MLNQSSVNSFFPDIIGQNKVKRQLAFYINSFRSTQILPHLFVVGGKGSGKTVLATMVARNLKVQGGKVKPMLKVNCATIRKLDALIENVFIPYVKDDVTIFFDEAHTLDPITQDALLTALNPDKNQTGYINYKDMVLEFPYKKISFIFATTDPQAMSGPLKDRLRHIQLEPYTQCDLASIIEINMPNIRITPEALSEAAKTCRGNPRASVKMAQDNIIQYCAAEGIERFDMKAWNSMRELLGINPLGVGETELQILNALYGFEGRSLTSVAAFTGLEKSAIMNEFESYLLKMGLMEVGVKGRRLTISGYKYVKAYKENNE